MIPSRRLVALAAVLVLPLMTSGIFPWAADVALLLNLLLLLTAVIDLCVSPSPGEISIEREVSEILSVGVANPAMIVLRNRSHFPLLVTLHDDPGEDCVVERLPQTVSLAPSATVSVKYVLRPLNRGESSLVAVHLRFATRLGLWVRQEIRPMPTAIRIYPDIRAVHRFELMARKNRLSEIGVRVVRMPGQGREFERLREFRSGDELRQIDWKATSRLQSLVSREFSLERNQNLVVMVDSGRFMRNECNGVSFFDHALNAAIMLSYIALGQGDNVSLLVFSNRIERYIRPVRGRAGIQQILRSTCDLKSSSHAADYTHALEYLTTVQRKRALVVLITFVADELQLRTIGATLRLRSVPYLSMCVLLQDAGLRKMADQIPETDLDAFHTASAAQILTGQSHEIASLREAGILITDTTPILLAERLINDYLNIKMKNLM